MQLQFVRNFQLSDFLRIIISGNPPITNKQQADTINSFVLSECTNENYNQFSFDDFFSFKTSTNMKITSTLLTLTPKLASSEKDANLIGKSDPILNYVQPMQIEAFRVKF